jgi:hypothetical protein
MSASQLATIKAKDRGGNLGHRVMSSMLRRWWRRHLDKVEKRRLPPSLSWPPRPAEELIGEQPPHQSR